MILLSCLVAGVAPAKEAQNPRAVALYREGEAFLKAGKPDSAAVRFQAAIQIDKRYAASYVGLGQVYLKQGKLDAAEKAFRQALRKQKRYAPAFNGLGLVYRERKNELRRAIGYFRDAMRADKTYAEAQYNLAQTYQRYGSSETMGAYEEVLKIDPNHPDASFQIGLIYEEKGEYKKAEQAYRHQIAVNPGHYGARLHLGIVLEAQGHLNQAVRTLESVASTQNPYQRGAVLELANVFQRARDYDHAQALFEAYIKELPPKEQALYYDLSLVAPPKLAKEYKAASPAKKKALFQAYWAGLDPAPVTAANERLVEHFRRVAFAREHFGKYLFPWDARGDVYVRYGNPDHISRSDDIRMERNPRVLAVKERLIARAGEAGAALAKQRASMNFSHSLRGQQDEDIQMGGGMGSTEARARPQIAASSMLGWPVYPVKGIWEYWIYVNVDDGLEVTFVQKNYPGPYEYAQMPLGMGKIARIWQDLNPRVQLQRAVAEVPNTYRPDFASGPLDFSFYSAAFKGAGGATALEIYYGIPTRELSFQKEEDGKRLAYLQRGVAVYDSSNRPVKRVVENMAVLSAGAADTTAGRIAPAMDRILLPPGQYRVAVQVLDRGADRTQVYNQERPVQAFGDSVLQLSDIELAASIQPAEKGPFVKQGVSVVPMATRTFRTGQPVYIYFEIYNLKRDQFGATKYRVSYQIESVERKSVGARVLGGLGKLLGIHQKQGVVTIQYEQTGTHANEHSYLQLDLSKTEPGVQVLEIRVTDENSRKQAEATTTFSVRR